MNPVENSPPPRRKRHWPSQVLLLFVLYVVATPPLFFSAVRVGLVRDPSTESPRSRIVSAWLAPARWLYEESPLEPVLQPWADFWYDALLT